MGYAPLLLLLLVASSPSMPFPPAPARRIPDMNGSAYPPYRLVFQPGSPPPSPFTEPFLTF